MKGSIDSSVVKGVMGNFKKFNTISGIMKLTGLQTNAKFYRNLFEVAPNKIDLRKREKNQRGRNHLMKKVIRIGGKGGLSP